MSHTYGQTRRDELGGGHLPPGRMWSSGVLMFLSWHKLSNDIHIMGVGSPGAVHFCEHTTPWLVYNGLYLLNGEVAGLCSIDFFTPHVISFKMRYHMTSSTRGQFWSFLFGNKNQ